MGPHSFYTRQMLMRYSKQLVSARRLARHEQRTGRILPDDDETQQRRSRMVEQVAREIMDNLIFSGSENPVVCEIKEELALKLGEQFEFQYPPADLSFHIFRVAKDSTRTEVGPDEKYSIMEALWSITLEKVNATML